MGKKKAIKLATATAIAASAFVAVAPTQSEAATSSVDKAITKATNQMAKAYDTYHKAAKDEKTLPKTATIRNEVKLANDYYTAATKEIAKNGGSKTQKATYTKKLEAKKYFLDRAEAYLAAVNTNLNPEKTAFNEAVEGGKQKTVLAAQTAYNKAIEGFEAKVDKIYGPDARNLLKEKYAAPAHKLVDSVNDEMKVYNAYKQIEGEKLIEKDLKKAGEVIESVKAEVAKLKAKDTKLAKNILVAVEKNDKAYEAAQVPVVKEVSAVNAKSIKVTFSKAIDDTKAKFEVKRGTIKPTVKEIKFSEDKKTATIEFSTVMAEGEYTVNVTGLTDEVLTGKTTVAAEKLTNIKFLSDAAVLSTDDIVAKVTAENQYGEDITSKLNTSTNSNITVTASKGTGTSIDKDGNLKVTGSANEFKADDKVVVTVVDSSTGITATKTLTVAKAAAVESIVLGELKTDDEELAKKTVNVSNMSTNGNKYYVPVTVKDQYGNTLKAADLAGVTVVSSNNNIVKPKASPFKDTKNGTVIELDTPTATATHGTAVLTVIASGTGKTANTSIVVKENSKLDNVTLEAPSTTLKAGVAAELPVSITNTYGEGVALKDVNVSANVANTELTLDTNTKISAIGATLKVEQDYVNKKAVLKVTPSAKNITITVVTATGKSQVLNFKAEDAPVPAGIKGLDKDFVSLLANDQTLTTDLKSAVEFTDQFGEEIVQPTFDAQDANNTASDLDFTIKAKDANNNVTDYNSATANGVISSSANAGTETYEVVLKEGTKVLDTMEVTVSVVDADKLTAFGIDDLNKFYTGATSAKHNQQVTVHGLLNGKKVKVKQSMVADVSANNRLKIGSDGAFTIATASDVIDTDGKDVASTLTVLVANSKNTYTVSKEVTYSDAAPVAKSLVAKYNGKEVSGAVQVAADTYDLSDSNADFHFSAKDQYGVAKTTGLVVVGTNAETGNSVTGTSVTLVPTKSIQLNVRIDGLSTSIKAIGE
ncbi:hypothetical protein ACQKL5_15710 [Peribacillus sp. NPDC097675]|uniref:COG1470 family protein n=1 Tax=Peribacillus sp. NPDC097675 TaxID=3390618 RepID=UPI003D074356